MTACQSVTRPGSTVRRCIDANPRYSFHRAWVPAPLHRVKKLVAGRALTTGGMLLRSWIIVTP